MKVGRFLLILTMFFSGTLIVFPLKVQVLGYIGKKSVDFWANNLVSICVTFIPAFCAIKFTMINTYSNISGGFLAVMLSFVYPWAMGLKMGYFEKLYQKYLIKIGIFICFIFAFGVSFYTIQIIKANKTKL